MAATTTTTTTMTTTTPGVISEAETKRAFKARVYSWAEALNVSVHWLGIRNMKHKWASCSTQGNLNFDSALLGLDSELQDYVIVHELLHLSVPNHGKLWQSLMRAHLGDWEKQQQLLATV